MAHYDLEEQEQIEAAKAWWKTYGNLVTGIVLAGSLAVVGWQGWNWYQASESAKASATLTVLERGLADNAAQKVRGAAGELAEKYGRTSQAALGTLLAARYFHENNDSRAARAQLQWVVDNGRDEVRDIARLRLVAVLIDEKVWDEALKQLDQPHAPAFAALYGEARGDVLAGMGKRDAARQAYRSALDQQSPTAGPARELLQQKLDQLGEAA